MGNEFKKLEVDPELLSKMPQSDIKLIEKHNGGEELSVDECHELLDGLKYAHMRCTGSHGHTAEEWAGEFMGEAGINW